ncbi:hypothetical protein L195_g019696 [Trifolium pratense]|uniref:Uncharacterized protein n=1 Tax=Trifolium pratense TaxID=57577 RepID=A0A2K3N0B6_TRIPR|nr:hypothetical protein L195_g019696 [Trifolium pratense]
MKWKARNDRLFNNTVVDKIKVLAIRRFLGKLEKACVCFMIGVGIFEGIGEKCQGPARFFDDLACRSMVDLEGEE